MARGISRARARAIGYPRAMRYSRAMRLWGILGL